METGAGVASSQGIGPLLAAQRRARHLSQLALAGEAGISARHLSFLESGRSHPSRGMILRLCEALRVPPREADAFLLAAGFAPAHRETPLEAPAMADVLAALRLLLRRHAPYPAAAFDGRWDLVMANEPYARSVSQLLAGGADPPAGQGPVAADILLPLPRPNLLRYLCHPQGARRALRNWEEAARAILTRVRQEARHTPGDAVREAILAEALAMPGIHRLLREDQAGWRPAALVVPVELLRPDGGIDRFLTTLATLGTAQDLTLRELRIETYHPAD
jgi:transcriptional regulator with XRE-family HTH domain